jgi:O-antigen/teichoic acid export membrane protein
MKFYSIQRSRYKRISKELFWIILGQIASFFGSIVLVRVLTEKLEPTEYGELALGLTIAGLVYQVVMGGINNGIGRFYSIAIEKKDLDGYLRASFRMLLWGTLVVIGLTIVLLGGLTLLGLEQWIWLLLVVLLFSILSSYNNALNALQNAARQRTVVALHGGMNSWLKIGLVIGLMLWLGTSSIAVVLGYVISAFIVTLSQIIFLKRLIVKQNSLIEPRTRQPKENWFKQIWKFSWPFSAWGLFTWAQLVSDRWAIEWFATTAEVGQFVVVYQLGYSSITMLTNLMMTLIAPILYERSGDAKDATRNLSVNRISWRITFASLALSILAFTFTYCLHDWLFSILVAKTFQEASHFLPWVVLAGGLFATGQMLALKVLSELRSSALIAIKIITALIGVLVNILGAWLFGLSGVVAALVIFSIIYLVWMIIMAKDSSGTEHSTD